MIEPSTKARASRFDDRRYPQHGLGIHCVAIDRPILPLRRTCDSGCFAEKLFRQGKCLCRWQNGKNDIQPERWRRPSASCIFASRRRPPERLWSSAAQRRQHVNTMLAKTVCDGAAHCPGSDHSDGDEIIALCLHSPSVRCFEAAGANILLLAIERFKSTAVRQGRRHDHENDG